MTEETRLLVANVADQIARLARSGELDLEALDLLADQNRTIDHIIGQLYRELAEREVEK